LLGPHQRLNLATALVTISALCEQGWHVPDTALTDGVARVQWPGRFEFLPLPEPGPNVPAGHSSAGPYVVADGAHNRASAHELARTLAEVSPGAPVHFIFGASEDKDILGMLEELAPRATAFTFTRSRHPRAASPESLAQLAADYPVNVQTAPTLAQALSETLAAVSPRTLVCITGSLFVAAEARELLLGLNPEL
jgi:dihydrofolate synthase/folylpolyglutamate synthase